MKPYYLRHESRNITEIINRHGAYLFNDLACLHGDLEVQVASEDGREIGLVMYVREPHPTRLAH